MRVLGCTHRTSVHRRRTYDGAMSVSEAVLPWFCRGLFLCDCRRRRFGLLWTWIGEDMRIGSRSGWLGTLNARTREDVSMH